MHRHLRLFAGHAESLVDAIRGSYWFVPMLMTLGSIALAFLLIEVASERDRDAVDAVFARVMEGLDDPSTEES
jgi:hypothetical protein